MMCESLTRQEALQYRPGEKVELKSQPGVFDMIAEYDPMMVPPIWLVNDPKPRYPEELKLVPQSGRSLPGMKFLRRSSNGWRNRTTAVPGQRASVTPAIPLI